MVRDCWRVLVQCLWLMLGSAFLLSAQSRPANDAFANATVISGASGTVTGSNAGATSEMGEPGIGGRTSVWWKWTAPFTAKTIFDTEGSDFDTVLSVYTGSALTNLSLVSEDDDLGEAGASRIVFDAVHDSVYYVAVHSFSNKTGNIQLNWLSGPSAWVVAAFRMTQTNQTSAFQIDQLWRWINRFPSTVSPASRAILDEQRRIVSDNVVRVRQIRRETLQLQQVAARTIALQPAHQIDVERLRRQSDEISSAVRDVYQRACAVALQEQLFLPPCIPPTPPCTLCPLPPPPRPPPPPTVSSQFQDSETATWILTILMAVSQGVQEVGVVASLYSDYAARLERYVSRSQLPLALRVILLARAAIGQAEAVAIRSSAQVLLQSISWDRPIGPIAPTVVLPLFSELEKSLAALRLRTLELVQDVQSAGISISPFAAPLFSAPPAFSQLTAVKWTFSSTGLNLVTLELLALDVLAAANVLLGDLHEIENAAQTFLPPASRAQSLASLQLLTAFITEQRDAAATVRERLRELEQEVLATDTPTAAQFARLNSVQTDLSRIIQSIIARLDSAYLPLASILMELSRLLPDVQLSTLSFPPVVPAFTSSLRFDGVTDRLRAGDEAAVMLVLDPPYPGAVSGKLTVKLRPGVTSTDDDPAVRFTSGEKSVEFSVGPETSQAQFRDGTASTGFGSGTVAGDIVLHATLQSDGLDLTPSPAPAKSLVLAAGPPTINDVRVVFQTPTSFEIAVAGFSTPREVTTATFMFTPRPGIMFQNARLVIHLEADFIRWYTSDESKAHGSRFTLTMPFTMQNSTNETIDSVSVTLSNRFGDSETVTKPFF